VLESQCTTCNWWNQSTNGYLYSTFNLKIVPMWCQKADYVCRWWMRVWWPWPEVSTCKTQSCVFLAKTVSISTAISFTILLVDGVGCGRSPWPLSMWCHLYLAWFHSQMMLWRGNFTERDIQKVLCFPQMEMHNGMKPVIILGVILQISSVKEHRWQVWGPSRNTGSTWQPGQSRETLFQWVTHKIFLKAS
jgi:hypothetical protein